jgi:hypothetical protein
MTISNEKFMRRVLLAVCGQLLPAIIEEGALLPEHQPHKEELMQISTIMRGVDLDTNFGEVACAILRHRDVARADGRDIVSWTAGLCGYTVSHLQDLDFGGYAHKLVLAWAGKSVRDASTKFFVDEMDVAYAEILLSAASEVD